MSVIDSTGSLTNPYSNFIAISRYARWKDDLNRRETWEETVTRYVEFMKKWLSSEYEYDTSDPVFDEVKHAILNLEVMPSMRALMSAGPALERNHIAAYNCSFIAVNDVKAFSEALLILTHGTGVGFSVARNHVENLPIIPTLKDSGDVIFVGDSKEEWARSLNYLLEALYSGDTPSWDLSAIRGAGVRLKTFGGRASGPGPLDQLFRFVVDIFRGAQGRRLSPLESHDIMCKIGDIVVSGGVRRCLVSNTLISTPSGFKKMLDISVGDEIISGGRKATVTAKVDSGKQHTVIIKHKFGESEMTPNHRIAVFDGMDSYTYKDAGDLIPGDRLVWDLAGYDGEIQLLPDNNYAGHFNAGYFEVPEILDTDTAWLIGLIHGDGYVHSRGVEISGCVDEWATLERAKAILLDKFKVSGSLGRDTHGGDGIRLRINSTGLALWLTEHVKIPKTDIKIPPFIMNAQRDVRRSYLAGVIDSDGRIREDGVIEQTTTIYESFAVGLQSLLMGLGLASKIQFNSSQRRRDNGENTQDYWTISVSGTTSRSEWINSVGVFSEKAQCLTSVDFGSPHDFSYPAEWHLAYRNRSTLRNTLVKSGKLNADYPFAPVAVLSVDTGSVLQTWDIEVEGIHEFTADGLVTHNSALISLSDLNDFEMAKAKSGNWWENHGHRALSNNSAVYKERPSITQFLREWRNLIESQSGERGIFNLAGARAGAEKIGRDGSKIEGTNPCAEILLRDMGFCNLTEIVVKADDTISDLKRKVRIASIMGTWQSSLTKFSNLRPEWVENAEEERLLGVSLTGIYGSKLMNNPNDVRLPHRLMELRKLAQKTNQKEADKVGINPSVAITTVKPSGTVSQLCLVSSGIHPWHSEHYTRTVRGASNDPLSKLLADSGIPAEPDVMKPDTNTVFSFPVAAPKGAVTRDQISALDHLALWLVYKENWADHSVSVTVSVREDEWLDVAGWVYKNFDNITGISFLPYADHVYQQAPYQEITQEEFEKAASEFPKEVRWSDLSFYETEDGTTGSRELACAADGTGCEVVDLTT